MIGGSLQQADPFLDIGNSGSIANNGQIPRPSPYDAFGDDDDDEFEMDDGANPTTPERQKEAYYAQEWMRKSGAAYLH